MQRICTTLKGTCEFRESLHYWGCRTCISPYTISCFHYSANVPAFPYKQVLKSGKAIHRSDSLCFKDLQAQPVSIHAMN